MKKLVLISFLFFYAGLIAQDTGDEYQFTPSDYFITQSSFSLPKGVGRYSNSWILFNDFHYGITNNISAGVGMIPLFFFAGTPSPIWLKVKGAVKVIDYVHVSGGLSFFTMLGKDVDPTKINLFGGTLGLTLGNESYNFSVNVYDLFNLNVEGNVLFYTLSGRARITPRTFLMAEFSDIGEDIEGMFILFGGETLFKNINLDYGLAYPFASGEEFLLIPYLGVKLPVGIKKSAKE